MQNCGSCAKWKTDFFTYPYGTCGDQNTVYAKDHFNSYYLEGSECKFYVGKEGSNNAV